MAPTTSPKSHVTVAGRDANWLDFDGTVVPSSITGFTPGVRVNIGSNWTGPDWWRLNDNCMNTEQNWVCQMDPNDSVASMLIHWADSSMEKGIGSTYCSNGATSTGYLPCPIGAVVTHFNRNEANAFGVSVMSRVTGPVIASSGGWFVRYLQGTPATITFTDMQVDKKTILHLAIPYPAGTTFDIYAKAPTWCDPGKPPYQSWYSICKHPFRSVNSIDEVRNSWGDTYFFDNSAQLLHIRIVSLDSFGYRFAQNSTYYQNLVWNSTSTYNTYFSRGGLDLLVTGSSFWSVVVTATSQRCNPRCPLLPHVSVPGINGSKSYSGPPQTPPNWTGPDYLIGAPEDTSSVNLGAVVGGIVGGVLAIALIAAILFFLCKKQGMDQFP